MSSHTKETLSAQIDAALALRLEANEALKAGELSKALIGYNQVLLQLRGLESPISTVYGPGSTRPIVGEESEEGAEPKEKTEPELKQEQVKNALLNTHLNMSLCYIKLERWKRALETAQAAQKLAGEEKNVKAAFREAQAKIGLGEVNAGRKQLEELQKTNPDTAITAALRKLDLDAKQSLKTSSTANAFRGMYNKKPVAEERPPLGPSSNSNHTSVPSDATATGNNGDSSGESVKATEVEPEAVKTESTTA